MFTHTIDVIYNNILMILRVEITHCYIWVLPWVNPNQKCMYGAELAISGNHFLYLVIFGMSLEPYYFELVIVGLRASLTMYDNI